jgi:hypothetical protein
VQQKFADRGTLVQGIKESESQIFGRRQDLTLQVKKRDRKGPSIIELVLGQTKMDGK